MPTFSKNDVVLVFYPYTDHSALKLRPAVVIQAQASARDLILVSLTSRTTLLQFGEFIVQDWAAAGLRVPSAVRRNIMTLHPSLVSQQLKTLSPVDALQLERSLRLWLGL